MVFLFECSREVVGIVITYAVGNLGEAEISADEQLFAALKAELLQVLQRCVARVFLEESSELGVSHVDGISDICGSDFLAELLRHDDFSLMDGFRGLLILEGVVAVEGEGIALQHVCHAAEHLLESYALLACDGDGVAVETYDVLVETHMEDRFTWQEEAIAHAAVDVQSLESYPVFVPSRGFVGLIAVPLTGEEQKHVALPYRCLSEAL